MADLRRYDAIYLSPHLDDVVFSCGAQIFKQASAGKEILVVTVTAGSPPPAAYSEFVQELHLRWGSEEATEAAGSDMFQQRRNEDVLACLLIGADCEHWDVLDCIYRLDLATGEQMYVTRDDIFGDVHPADEPLLERLAERIVSLPPHAQLYVPLTAGHHVDHQLTRLAAERFFPPSHLSYYEDYPYVREPELLAAVLESHDSERWRPQVLPFGESALEAKVAAVLAYESQLSTFFNSSLDVEQQIKGYARQVLEAAGEETAEEINPPAGAERVWKRV